MNVPCVMMRDECMAVHVSLKGSVVSIDAMCKVAARGCGCAVRREDGEGYGGVLDEER